MNQLDYRARTHDQLRQLIQALLVAAAILSLGLTGLFVAVMPLLFAEGLTALAAVAVIVFVFYRALPGAPLWAKSVAIVFVLNLILNYGFSNEIVGVGRAVMPVSELILAIAIPIVVLRYGRRIFGDLPSVLFLIAAALPLLTHLPFDVDEFQLDAARDAMRNVDMFFYFLGAGLVFAAGTIERWQQWRNQVLRWAFVGQCVYFLLYPAADLLQRYSPYSFSYQQPVALFGHFQTAQVFVVPQVLLFFLMPGIMGRPGAPRQLLALLLSVGGFAALILFQLRTTYFVLAASIGLVLLAGRVRLGVAMLVAALATIGVVAAAVSVGVDVSGRVDTVSIETVEDQLVGIADDSAEHVQGRGFTQRIDWWKSALRLWAETPATIVFGVGYGKALTDFRVAGSVGEVVVREPHNSFVTALVRGGLIGFIPWMLFFLWLIGRLATVIINGASHRDAERTYALWLAIVLLSAFVTSIFEPVFELPFEAMPIYLLCGAFAAECRLTRSAQSHSASSAPAA